MMGSRARWRVQDGWACTVGVFSTSCVAAQDGGVSLCSIRFCCSRTLQDASEFRVDVGDQGAVRRWPV